MPSSARSGRRAICSHTTTSRTVDVIRLGKHGGRELVPMRWGLIPGWWKKTAKEMPATFNARAESVADKPMSRNAFKGRRCIIPAADFTNGQEGRGPSSHIYSPRPTAPRLSCSPACGTAGAIRRRKRKFCPAPSSCRTRAPGWNPITTACRCCWRRRISTPGWMARPVRTH
jgi:SOS response associated peptidase (SRAP)